MEQQVDFYILGHNEPTELQAFVTRLCSKVHQSGKSLLVWTKDENQATNLDQWLWKMEPESFIPHEICQDNQRHILIGNQQSVQVVLNLACSEPEGTWTRMLYVVTNEDESLSKARDLYKYFKQQSIPIKTHKLN